MDIPYENIVFPNNINGGSCVRFQNFDVMTKDGVPYIVTDGCDARFRIPQAYNDTYITVNDSSTVSGVTFDGWKGVAQVPIGNYYGDIQYSIGDSMFMTESKAGTCLRNDNTHGYGSNFVPDGKSQYSPNPYFNVNGGCQAKFTDAHKIYGDNGIDCYNGGGSSKDFCTTEPDRALYNYYIGVEAPADVPTMYPKLTPQVTKNGKPVGDSGTCKRGYNWGVKDAANMWVNKNCHATFIDEYNNKISCPTNWKACSSTSGDPWCSFQNVICPFSATFVNMHKCDNVDCTKTYCAQNQQCVDTYCNANPKDSKCLNSVPCAGVDCTKTLCVADSDCYLEFCANNPTNDACKSTWVMNIIIFVVVAFIIRMIYRKYKGEPVFAT
jgi:hypothetical protein